MYQFDINNAFLVIYGSMALYSGFKKHNNETEYFFPI